MLQAASHNEVQTFVPEYSSRVDERGRRLVVRNAQLPAREIVTGAGSLKIRHPRVRDKSADPDEREHFSSSILPPYPRKSRSIEELIPRLYRKGISTGDFSEALQPLARTRPASAPMWSFGLTNSDHRSTTRDAGETSRGS